MWKPSNKAISQIRCIIDKTFLYQSPCCAAYPQTRNFNNGEIESRYKKTKSGWFSRRGTRPGYPASWPTSRVVGVDLNLQVKNEYSRGLIQGTSFILCCV